MSSGSAVGEPRPPAVGPFKGRRIDSVEVGGYREESKDDVDEWMRLLSGRPYDERQVRRVWRLLLKSGGFDEASSALRVEEGEMGGLGKSVNTDTRTRRRVVAPGRQVGRTRFYESAALSRGTYSAAPRNLLRTLCRTAAPGSYQDGNREGWYEISPISGRPIR